MVDITDRLSNFLIESEKIRLESKYGGEFVYIEGGRFERVSEAQPGEPVSVRRVQTASAFEPPPDNDPELRSTSSWPTNPRTGDLWFNASTHSHHVFNGDQWTTIQDGDIVRAAGHEDVVITHEMLQQREHASLDIIYGTQVVRPEAAVTLIDANDIQAGTISTEHIESTNFLPTQTTEDVWDSSRSDVKAKQKLQNSNEELKRKIDL